MYISSFYKKTFSIISLSLLSYMTYNYYNDNKRANNIKKELLEHSVKNIYPRSTEYAVYNAEEKEPFFNKTNYWELEAVKIKKELDAKKAQYINVKNSVKHSSTYHTNE